MKQKMYLVDYTFNVGESFVKRCNIYISPLFAKVFFLLKCLDKGNYEVNLYRETRIGDGESRIKTLKHYHKV